MIASLELYEDHIGHYCKNHLNADLSKQNVLQV